jgi:GTPase involved in cell partitioning and DNA repair
MAAAVHRRDRSTSRDLNPSTATRPEQEISGNAGQTGNPTLPAHRTQPPKINANGDTSQAAQIQLMVSQKYNVILVDAGSSTALNSVLESAVGRRHHGGELRLADADQAARQADPDHR